MIIAIAGIKRSGSTAMYNMVRLALLEAGYDINICGHNWDERRKNMLGKKEADIIKRHPFDETIAKHSDHIFLTDRNDEDILKSLNRMWGSGNPERLEDMRKHLNKWMTYNPSKTTYLRYELFKKDQYNWVINVLRGLEILGKVSPLKLLNKLNNIEPPKKKQDPVTLLFPNHISE